MNCTNCGQEIKEAICSNCGTNHTELFYKLVEDAQVRRDYPEALSYMLLIRKSCKDKHEITEIDRKIAKLQFSMTDLTGNSLNSRKRNNDIFSKLLKSILTILIIFLIMIGGLKSYNIIFQNETVKNKKFLPVALNIIFKEKDLNNEVNVDKIDYIIDSFKNYQNLKLNIVLNGLLIEKIQKLNPDLIEKMKKLISERKLEILGTSYSEAVLASNSLLSNKWQIEKNKEQIKQVFGVTPLGFWNEGGVWNENIGKLIKNSGYEYVIIEDRIIKKSNSKFPEYVLRSTENGNLLVINNDKDFVFKIEKFLLEKKPEVLNEIKEYIKGIYKSNKNNDYILNYSSNIYLENVNLLAIEDLFQYVSNLKFVRIINYPMILNEVDLVREDITPITNGVSVFSDLAVELSPLKNKYKTWEDFNKNYPKLNELKSFFLIHENIIKNLPKKNKNLKNLYLTYYLKSQYKLGIPLANKLKNEEKLKIFENFAKIISIEQKNYEKFDGQYHYIKNNNKIYLLYNNKIILLYNESNDSYIENFTGEKTINLDEFADVNNGILYTNNQEEAYDKLSK